MAQSIDFCISLEECYETIIQTMDEGVFVVNRDGFIIFANQAMGAMTGYPNTDLIGKPCHDIINCDCDRARDCPIQSGRDLLNRECDINRHDGLATPVLRNAKVKKEASGEVKGVIETVTDISDLKQARRQVAELESRHLAKSRYQSMIGKSDAMRNVFNLIQLAADSSASILLTGESGTGKEMVAELIHRQSARQPKTLVKVNCSALSENLLESELFGHVRGAFTGAIKDKIGRFEIADEGTLFLDEISDISPLIQLKILRFLQEKEFERVGDHVTRKSDVRIISATNKDLPTLIQEGQFREDLFYRLKVFPIKIPSLRERKEDVPLLVEHFINKFNIETGKQIHNISRKAITALLDYHWPGNVRELENAIEHAFVIRRSGEIRLSDLPPEVSQATPQVFSDSQPHREDATANTASSQRQNAARQDASVSKETLLNALDQFKWNKTQVARHLEINRTTVWRLMKRYGI